jgi:hypothetical protein
MPKDERDRQDGVQALRLYFWTQSNKSRKTITDGKGVPKKEYPH